MTGPRLGFFTRLLEDAPAADRYRFALEQIEQAERSGFASAWVAQHHFGEHEGGLPSPLDETTVPPSFRLIREDRFGDFKAELFKKYNLNSVDSRGF